MHPNVALRCREFELKAETIDWRRSLDKTRSSSVDTESQDRHEPRARSLSAESHSQTSTITTTTDTEMMKRDEPPIPPPRNKHSGGNQQESHQISAVRNTNGKEKCPIRKKIRWRNCTPHLVCGLFGFTSLHFLLLFFFFFILQQKKSF